MSIVIWDKKSKLKNIDREVWFEAYPRSKKDTLVLIDDSNVYFLEDIKAQGFEGDNDTAIVEAFIKKEEENRLKLEQEQEKNKEAEKNETELLKEQIEKMKVDHAKQIAELVEKSESDKLELSTAIVELTEQLAQQG